MLQRIILSLVFSSSAYAAVVDVSTAEELEAAVENAQPGDEIVLANGIYELSASLNAAANGTSAAPITVRAATRHGAQIRFDALEGFKVSGRNWTFDGLDVQGVCAVDDDCEHAFHVSGDAQFFILRNSRLRDFNAQVKVNAAQDGSGNWLIPNSGLIERNEVFDTRSRTTSNPVTKLNIDTGDAWIVRDNLIYDFHKLGGDSVSYGAFMKSGGRDGLFERNLVICTRSLTTGGVRLGLSFGGGGTAPAFCAPAFDPGGTCDPEHSGGVMRNNVIANCSDVGIYLNKATDSRVLFNTLIDTSGIDFRFASSTGEADGNVLSGVIRERNDATVDKGTNLENVSVATFNSWYVTPPLDLGVEGDIQELLTGAPARSDVRDDFCARPRAASGSSTLGAIEHSLGDCETWPGTPTQTLPDAGTDGGSDGGTGSNQAPSGTLTPEDPVGCNCASGAGGAFAGGLMLVALMSRRMRARRRH